jgi:ribosomal protein L15E
MRLLQQNKMKGKLRPKSEERAARKIENMKVWECHALAS